jgi:hypothetical protein
MARGVLLVVSKLHIKYHTKGRGEKIHQPRALIQFLV